MSPQALRLVGEHDEEGALIVRFAARYPNRGTAMQYTGLLTRLERDTKASVQHLHADDLIRWCASPGLANNSVRGRKAAVVAFLRWCERNDIPAANPTLLTDRDSPLRSFGPTYGRAQSKNPGRWLTKDEAFGRLVGTCQDGTPTGLRDELVLRCGLATLRATEIAKLTVGAVQLDTRPVAIVWTGKHRKPRRADPGDSFLKALNQWLGLYAEALGRTPAADDPLLCPTGRGRKDMALAWGTALSSKRSIYEIVRRRATKAGLGHVAPHDLKRSNAGILHRAVTPEGAHFYDLRDIQKVHGHKDPMTTLRSYIEPMDTDVIARAGATVD